MKYKEKECAWAPGMQETDVTYAGEHTWAEIVRARKARESQNAPGPPKGLLIILVVGVIALALGGWLIY